MTFETPETPRNRAERRAAERGGPQQGRRTTAAVLAVSSTAIASTAMILAGSSVVSAAGTITVDNNGDGAATPANCTNVTAGDCTLRDAIAAASSGDTIAFDLNPGSVISLNGEIAIKDLDLTITGPGAADLTIDAQTNGRVFDIYSSDATIDTVVISGLTFINGEVSTDGGAIDANGVTLSIADSVFSTNYAEDDGGAVAFENSNGNLTISGSTFTGNSAGDDGGAIQLNGAYGAVLIEDSVIGGDAAADPTVANHADGQGGGIYGEQDSGGDESAARTLTISRTTISGNTAADGGGGAALDDWYGLVSVQDSVISNNSSGDWGGGLYFEDLWAGWTVANTTISGNDADWGGGIAAWSGYGPVSITGSTISGNTSANDAGGIGFGDLIDRKDANDATIDISTTTVSGNSAALSGGGIWVGLWSEGNGNQADVTLLDSTVSGNTAGSGGGGVFVAYNYGSTSIIQSTLTGNVAQGGEGASYDGGAVAFRQTENADQALSITQSTISGNTGVHVGGVYLPEQSVIKSRDTGAAKGTESADADDPDTHPERTHGSGAHAKSTSFVNAHATIVGTILAGNAGDDLGTGGIVTASSSIFSTISSGTTFTNGGGNQLNVTSLLLGPLQDNGGPTHTMALLPGSPAIDAGAVPPPSYPTNDFDQRGDGYVRVNGGIIDVGAFEVQPVNIEPNFTG